ncbi:MAG: hypothetical protein JEZ03_03150 [Bacteroidales bacterium]|nr:hypothetical protein [Bacteroidales bacterium]
MLSEKKLRAMQIVLISLLFVIVMSCLFFYYLNPTLFERITAEDGLVENATAFFLLLCSLISFQKLFFLKKWKNQWWIAVTLGIAVVAFFVFGEEISWGQRIFDLGSTEFFKNFNTQEETNLHNLSINGFRINQWIFGNLLSVGLGIYFLVFVPLYKRNTRFAAFVDYMGIPVPRPSHSIEIVISAVVVMIMSSSSRWELLELAFVLVLFMVLLYPQNRNEIYGSVDELVER